VTNVKECCLDLICGKSNQVEDAKATASQEPKRQEAYEDDRYLERFETLEDRTKMIENKIDRILNSIDQQNRSMIELSNQMKLQKESIDQQNRGLHELAK